MCFHFYFMLLTVIPVRFWFRLPQPVIVCMCHFLYIVLPYVCSPYHYCYSSLWKYVCFLILSPCWTYRCVIWCAEIQKRSLCVPSKLWWMYCKKRWLIFISNGWFILPIKSHQSQYVGLVHGIIFHFSVWLIVYIISLFSGVSWWVK